MTLWNPLNVFSGQSRPAGDETSASFDPARTGDPLGPNPGRPAIGIGDTRVGGAAGPGDPRRHPVGFAPPEEQAPATRYRTEISFKRHHELPRASATLDRADSPEPEPAPAMHDAGADDFGAAAMEELGESQGVVEETPEAADVTPFYRREISFRRKRPAAGEVDVAAAVLEDEPADEAVEVADRVEHEDVVEAVAVVEEPDAPEATEVDDTEVAAVEETAAEATVPFYKREIGFRRKHEAVAVVAAAEVVAQADDQAELEEPEALEVVAVEETVVEETPVAEATVPFYKREIGFRRKHETAAVVVAAEVVAQADGQVEQEEPVAVAEEPEAPEVAAAVVPPAEEAVVSEPTAEVAETQAVGEEAEIEDGSELSEVECVAATEPSVIAAVSPTEDVATAVEETESDADTLGEMVESSVEGSADPVEDWPGAEEMAPSAVVAAEAVAEAGEPAASDEAATDEAATDESATDEAPAPVGRFAGRRNRSSEKKASRRKSGHGSSSRKVVGLKIGASQIAAAVVSETEAGFELLELARRPLEAGIVVDGEVRDESALASAVKALFDEEKLPRNDVRIGLASNRIGVRTIDIPATDDEARFDNAVRFRAHEVLPVALHESVLDYRVLEERSGAEGESLRRVLLVVAPRDQVVPYERMAGEAGIKLGAIDLEALGLLRAFVDPKSGLPTADDTASVVVAIGHESSTLLVAGGGTCEFTRVFDWGGGALEDAIGSALEVRPAEAAMILRHLSLSGPGRQYESLDEVARAKATEAVRLRLTPFARELVNSLQFYQTQAESLGIGGIVITGGTSHLEGLSEALHQMIGVDVSVGDPFARVIRAGGFEPEIETAIGSMAVSIGLAIDDGSARSVNLVAKRAVDKPSTRKTAIAIGVPIAAAIPLMALGFLFVGAHGKAGERQADLDAVKAEIAALPEPTVATIDAGVVGDEAVRATAVASVLGGRLAWDAVFRDMARVLPENVWLTGLSVAMPDAGTLADGTAAAAPIPGQAAGAPTAVSVEGFTYSQPDVARLLARLATLPSLARVTLTTSQSEAIAGKPVVRFTIMADLSQTGGAS